MNTATRIRIWAAVIIIGAIYILLQFGVGFYTNLLWFTHLGFEDVYMTHFWGRWIVGLAVAIPFALLFLGNLLLARWQSVRNILFFSEETLVSQPIVQTAIWGATAILALGVGTAASQQWLLFLRYWNQKPFDIIEPVFNMDVGFYIFSLPFYQFVQNWLLTALFFSLIGSVAIYLLAQQNSLAEGRFVIVPHVQLHLSILGAFIFFVFAVGHWLDMFDLSYSTQGVVFGVTYTDVNVSVPALQVMIVLAVIVGIVLIANTYLRRPVISLGAIFIWIVVGIISRNFIPSIVQNYVVSPNELNLETPYIQNNIEYTNIAYDLANIRERDFSQVEALTHEDLANNGPTIQSIRLWDYRPLEQTYQQIQAIRPYYNFLDIDLDRYWVDGELRQLALAARELEKSRLPAISWVTERLQFTHGYGVVANPVNEVTTEGLPRLWIKDLPPQSSVDIQVTRPEIYYGEADSSYVFVNTQEREFNYPSGDENVFTEYAGEGGVVLDSYLKRLAFAFTLADINMLLSQEFTPRSRVLLHQNIRQRVQRIAPFLYYDGDPYLVIDEEGVLHWIQDAYTISSRFPYSRPYTGELSEYRGLNYIRNSVKISIDAYNGDLKFYVVDPTDPIIRSYMSIFPTLFVPLGEIPSWMQDHLRYPVDIFRIQATLYQTYHMSDVNVFYNQEDVWAVPQETFIDGSQAVEPYYVILKLPGETENEFVLIQPFTPNTKNNLIAWMAARSDGEHYGQLVVFRFPKQELIFGPFQIEARIEQNPEISSQLTLWGQGGSEVIRGNLLVLPIDDALLYVEPLYLRAANGQIPELKRVILASGDQVVMQETLADALLALLGEAEPIAPPSDEASLPSDEASPSLEEPLSDDIDQLALTASEHYEAAQRALQEGDWTTYGEELEKMEAALNALVELTQETPPE